MTSGKVMKGPTPIISSMLKRTAERRPMRRSSVGEAEAGGIIGRLVISLLRRGARAFEMEGLAIGAGLKKEQPQVLRLRSPRRPPLRMTSLLLLDIGFRKSCGRAL